jgi:integrase
MRMSRQYCFIIWYESHLKTCEAFRFHALRHFGASLLDQSNVPIGSIQRILGHENRTTTEIYLHAISRLYKIISCQRWRWACKDLVVPPDISGSLT